MPITLDGTTGITTDGLTYSGTSAPSLFQAENRVINGGFDFWQRGTSFAVGYDYTADRWLQDASGGTYTTTRQSFTAGDMLGMNNPQFFLRQAVSGQTLASHKMGLLHRIENVRSYAGQTITILGWARRSSGAGNMVVEAFQLFGGSPNAGIASIGITTVTLVSTWQPFAVTMTIPSLTGQTISALGNDYLELNFWTSAGSSYNSRTNSLGLQTITVDFWGIHVRVGAHTADATALYRSPERQTELSRCQRYYHRANADATITVFGAGYNTTTTTAVCMVPFPEQMRAAPSLATSGTAGQYSVAHLGGTTVCSSLPAIVSLNQVSRDAARVQFLVASGLTAGQGSMGISNSTSAFLAFDAELF